MAAPRSPRGSHIFHRCLAVLAFAACLPLCAADGLANVVMLGGLQSPERMRVVALAPRHNITQASIAAFFDIGFAGVQVQVRHTLDHRLVVFGDEALQAVAPETCPDEICGEGAHTRLTQEQFSSKMHDSLSQVTWQHFLEHITISNGHKLELLEDVMAAIPAGKFVVAEPSSRSNPTEAAGYLTQQAQSSEWSDKMQMLVRRDRTAQSFRALEGYKVWYRREVRSHTSGWDRNPAGTWFADGWHETDGVWSEDGSGSRNAFPLQGQAEEAIRKAAQYGASGVAFEADINVINADIQAYCTTGRNVELAAFGWDLLDGTDYVVGGLAMQALSSTINLYSYTTHVSPDVEAWVAAGQPDNWVIPTDPPPPSPEEEPKGLNWGLIIAVVLVVLVLGAVAAYVSLSKGDEAQARGSSVEMKGERV